MGCKCSFLKIGRKLSNDNDHDNSNGNSISLKCPIECYRRHSSIHPEISSSELTCKMHCTQMNKDDFIHFGPMHLKLPKTEKILMVLGKDDDQARVLRSACSKASLSYDQVTDPLLALRKVSEEGYAIVLIDHRYRDGTFEPNTLCTSMLEISHNDEAVFVGLRSKSDQNHSVIQLLQAGYHRAFTENLCEMVCYNEIVTILHQDVVSCYKLRASNALFTLLESSGYAMEISNSKQEVQYVNPCHQRMFGFAYDEVVGSLSRDATPIPDNAKIQNDVDNTINQGKPWRGLYHSSSKSGESIQHYCCIYPVQIKGKTQQFLSVKSFQPILSEYVVSLDPTRDAWTSLSHKRADSMDIQSNYSIDAVGYSSHRKSSLGRILSPSIKEAPITRAINMLGWARDKSSFDIGMVLEQCLELLRNSELYNPAILIGGDDPTGYVDGLMTAELPRKNSEIPRRDTDEPHQRHAISIPVATPMLTLSPDLISCLENCMLWDFDIFNLEKLSNNEPLLYMGMYIFNNFHVHNILKTDAMTLWRWFKMIESNYHRTNDYHNSTHAADVLNAAAYFLSCDRIQCLDDMDIVAALITAVIHDFNHPGVTNNFLINSRNDLALLYNDISVLENHHVSHAFKMTSEDDVNIFKNLEGEEFRNLRRQIVDSVLATDVSNHYIHTNKFAKWVNVRPASTTRDPEKTSIHSYSTWNNKVTEMTLVERNKLVQRMLIKCADISNPTRPLKLCIEWANRIANEYFKQSEREKKDNLPLSMPFYDKDTCSLPKCQVGFVELLINDMFEAWNNYLDIPDVMIHLHYNFEYWKELVDETQENAVGS